MWLQVDLTGGYYDAGDNVKFGLPMAFTLTMLAWSVVEFSEKLQQTGQLGHTLNALRWGTDYLLKASQDPNQLWVQVRLDPTAGIDRFLKSSPFVLVNVIDSFSDQASICRITKL